MHGLEASHEEKFWVLVTGMPVYKVWQRYQDGGWSSDALICDPDAGRQILYAARVLKLLGELDSGKLRKLAQACFPPRTAAPFLALRAVRADATRGSF